MPLAKNFVPQGFSGQQAQSLTACVIGSGLTAAGTTQGTALALTADMNTVSAGGGGGGVKLYDGQIGDSQEIFNDQLTYIVVYPPTGDQINQVALNGGVNLPAYTYGYFKKITASRWIAMMSA